MFRDDRIKDMVLAKLRDTAIENTILIAASSNMQSLVEKIAVSNNCRFDYIITRQIEVTLHDNVCIGAVAEGMVYVVNEEAIAYLNINRTLINTQIQEQANRIKKQRARLGHAQLKDLSGKQVILIADVIKSGINILAALKYLSFRNVGEVFIISERASKEGVYLLESQGARVVSVERTDSYNAICGQENYFEYI